MPPPVNNQMQWSENKKIKLVELLTCQSPQESIVTYLQYRDPDLIEIQITINNARKSIHMQSNEPE